MKQTKDYGSFHPKTRKAWRNWLERNHDKEQGVWLVYYKKDTGKRRVSYDEAVEEALCFGWIDSLPRKLDEERSMLKFTPRKPKSVWSDLNKKRIEKLLANGMMTKAGMDKIDAARKDGSWNTLNTSNYHADGNTLPDNLLKAFGRNRKALDNFRNFSASIRRQFLYWIDSAKRPETRTARMKQTVLMSVVNKKPDASGFKL